MTRGRKPIGTRAMSDAERIRKMRERRPRTEELYRAMAMVLRQGVRDGWINEMNAYLDLVDELESLEVGPEKRRLTKAERQELASKLLGGR